MKTIEQLAKEFVCNVGREPTEKQEMEIKALVMFGKAVIKECQLTPVMKPTSDQIYRILDVFEFMQNDCIYPANSTPEHDETLKTDFDRIRTRYEELRWQAGFPGAMKIAKAEYIYWVFSGSPTPQALDACHNTADGLHLL